jgi:hypothetical protein
MLVDCEYPLESSGRKAVKSKGDDDYCWEKSCADLKRCKIMWEEKQKQTQQLFNNESTNHSISFNKQLFLPAKKKDEEEKSCGSLLSTIETKPYGK